MLHILTDKKLEEIKDKAKYTGYLLGYQLGKTEARNMGIIISSQMRQDIEQILKTKGVDNG